MFSANAKPQTLAAEEKPTKIIKYTHTINKKLFFNKRALRRVSLCCISCKYIVSLHLSVWMDGELQNAPPTDFVRALLLSSVFVYLTFINYDENATNEAGLDLF